MENQTEELVLETPAEDVIDRIDLEQDINRFLQILDEIDLLLEYVVDSTDTEFTRDNVANYLIGLKTIYTIKANKIDNTFEHMIKTGQFK